ncbi:MAG: 50S ribosomal protein L40e [Candidatus Nanoarchaeia archaeon]
MPAKIPEAIRRLFQNVWICRRCKKKIRADILKVKSGKIICPRCGQQDFRPKSKEKRISK